MAIEIVALANGQLSATEAQLYAVPADRAAIVKGIRLVNTDTGPLTVNLYYRRSGGTSRRIIPMNLSLAAGAAFIDDGEITMQEGDSIRGDAGTATKVDYVLSGVERGVA